jgi:uncharacterized Tic20 family protein
MNVAEELQKLHQLRQAGAINDDEFVLAKAKLLSAAPEAQPAPFAPFEATGLSPETREQETRQWAMFLHLSVLAGYVVPIAGLIVPIVIWQMKKVDLPGIDSHGKNALNWIISAIIYAVVCFILVFAIIGIPLLIALFAISVIFPIVAGIKASQGEVWKYPLAITFMK